MRMIWRFGSIVILLLLFLAHVPISAWAAGGEARFGLRPARSDPARPATQSYFIYDAAYGQELQDEVLVRNSGDAAGIVRLYAVDSTTGDNSGPAYLDESAPRQDVGNWVRLAEREFSLGPSEERVIPFTVTIPADALTGQHLGGIVAVNTAEKQGSQAGAIQINTLTRAITPIQVNLPGAIVERVAVTSVATGGRQARQTVILGLRNDGTQMVKPTGMLTVTNGQGLEVQRLPLKLDTFLPGSAIQYPVAVQKQALGTGQYHAKVDLTYGTSGVTHYEGDFSISAAQVAQIFPSAVALAPPPVAAGASAAPTPSAASARAQWPFIAGGGVLLVLVLVGGIFLGRRGRPGGMAK